MRKVFPRANLIAARSYSGNTVYLVYPHKHKVSKDRFSHCGSGINAVPVLTSYREHPDDYYLLRVGYGGTMGAL